MSSADARDALRATLHGWLLPGVTSNVPHADSPLVATLDSEHHAILALLDLHDEPVLLAAQELRRRWRCSVEPLALLDLVRQGNRREIPTQGAFRVCAEQLVSRWLTRRSVMQTMGAPRSESSPAYRALRRRLDLMVTACPLSDRVALAARAQRLTSALARAWSWAVDREIRRLLRTGLAGEALLAAAEQASRHWIARRQNEPRTDARLVALLLFHPATSTTAAALPPTPSSPSPPSASP